MATPITDSNHNGGPLIVATATELDVAQDVRAVLAEVAALRTELAALAADVAAMRAAWTEYEPVVAAFRRGGWLAARSAAKRAGASQMEDR